MIIPEQILIVKSKDIVGLNRLIDFQNNIIENNVHLLFNKSFIKKGSYAFGFVNLGIFTLPIINIFVLFIVFLMLNLAYKIKFKGKGFLRWVFPREAVGVLL